MRAHDRQCGDAGGGDPLARRYLQSGTGIEDAYFNYIVLTLAAIFEGATWWIAVRSIGERKGEAGYVEAFRKSKDPPTFMVLFEDSAALIGIGLAFLGTWAPAPFNCPLWTGWLRS